MHTYRSSLVGALSLFLLGAALQSSAAAEESAKKIYQQTLLSTAWVKASGGSGTAWVVDRSRKLLVTNHHVVEDDDTVNVVFPIYRNGKAVAQRSDYKDRRGISGKVIDVDPLRDLAIIQLEVLPEGVDEVKLAPESASPGDRIHAIGNPGASDALWVYTSGSVRTVYRKEWSNQSGKSTIYHRSYVMETQAPHNPGDSGGPVVNDQGELVGVVSGGKVFLNGQPVSLVNWSIDVREVKAFLDQTRRLMTPQSAADFALHGERLTLRKRYAAALDDYTTALQLDKNCQAAYRNRGRTFYLKGDDETAIEDLNRAVELNSSDALAYAFRALALARQAESGKGAIDYSKALADYTKAIQLHPKFTVAYNNRGNLHYRKGEMEQALADFSHAIDSDPSYALAYLNRGDVYRSRKEYKQALGDYEQAMNLSPSASAVTKMAGILNDTRDYDTAIKLCNLSLKEFDKEFATTYAFRARALAAKGNLDDALSDYSRAIDLDKNYAWAIFQRAEVYENAGDINHAQADYDRAIQLNKGYAARIQAYDRRYLRVINNTDETLRIYIQYETLSTKDKWQWFPDAPGNGKVIWLDVPPGKATYVVHDDFKIKARRVRIWGEGKTSGNEWNTHKNQDLWIVPEAGYRAQKEMTISYVFPGKK